MSISTASSSSSRGDGLEDEALRAAIDEAGYEAAPAR